MLKFLLPGEISSRLPPKTSFPLLHQTSSDLLAHQKPRWKPTPSSESHFPPLCRRSYGLELEESLTEFLGKATGTHIDCVKIIELEVAEILKMVSIGSVTVNTLMYQVQFPQEMEGL
ncbi:Homeobox-leucine zipper family protein / lipid-binding START domain-containing protein [Perilla frutescens var. frutescens]|nr:Homeobox-leucine zipper family protein / lipid-binding START domain-containing protein [Perilla frutescens var. frutescens]